MGVDEKNPVPVPSPVSQGATASTEVHAVGFKAPPFWKSNVEPYFVFIEAQFATSGISADQTKYFCLVAALDESILSHVSDLICRPPQTGKYDALKRRLIEHFSESEAVKLQMLLHDLELGDKKPSALLREMKELAKNFSTEAVKALWLKRLPVSVQQILSVSTAEDLEKQAEMADKIIEVSKGAGVFSVNKKGDGEVSELTLLRNEISELRSQVSRLSRNHRRSKSRERVRSKSPGAKQHKKEHQLCWYHFRFGENAHKCNPPCIKFVSGNE